ncbi:MAG: hypothetical protein AMXMBFR47_35710 [Planctomycetota bacterium]
MAHRQRHKGSGTLYRRGGSGPFIVRWFDHTGRRREASTRCTDRAAAERILAKKIADASLRRDGVIDARGDGFHNAERRGIGDHVNDWIVTLSAKRVSEQQLVSLQSRVTAIFAAIGADRLSAISASAVQSAIGSLHKDGRSLQTCQHYLRAVKQFSRWLHRDGRIREDVLAHLAGFNTATDRRYERRAFSAQELTALFTAAEIGPPWRGLTGPARAVLYRVAVGTGFRAGELASLRSRDFDLDANSPRIILSASHSKRRRENSQPIRRDLADLLKAFLKGRAPDTCVWPGSWHKRAAAMLQLDLRRAKAAYIRETTSLPERRARRADEHLREVDAVGRVGDFHALRATYITMLVQSGASPKVAQALARHSTPLLTLGVYAKLGVHDLTGALESLAPLEPPVPVRATGTDGAVGQSDKNNHRLFPRQLRRETGRNGAGRCDSGGDGPAVGDARNRRENGANSRETSGKRKGGDSNPRWRVIPPRRFSKPLP